MFEDYKKQIDELLKKTEEEQENQTVEKIAAVTMYKVMIKILNNYVESESKINPDFNEALSLNHKSAGRMLKYIFDRAKKLAIRQNNVSSCCIPREAVFNMIYEYYFLDDKAEVEAEIKAEMEKIAAEEKKKEQEEQFRQIAIATLSKKAEWTTLTEKEQEEQINKRIKSLKASEKRKETKKAATKQKEKKQNTSSTDNIESSDDMETVNTSNLTDKINNTDEPAATNIISNTDDLEENFIEDFLIADEDTDSTKTNETISKVEAESYIASDLLDGQMSLFNFI